MKKTTLFVMLLMAVLTSCSNNNEDNPSGTATIGFGIANYEQLGFDEVTRAEATSLANLDMGIYDASTQKLVACQQLNNDDEGYGSFNVTLPYGSYTAVFLGYDGSRKANLEQLTSIAWPDNYVPNCFLKTLSLNIDANTAKNQAVTLERCIAAFVMKSEGGLPSNLNTLTFASKGGSHHLNALKGKADQTEERSYTYNVANFAGKDTISVAFFTFLTAETANMDFNVTARDKAENVLRTRDFNHVPMKINQRSRYSGNFFATEENTQGFNLQLGEDWKTVNYTY